MGEAVPLEGGFVNEVVRVGDTVRRRVRRPQPFVHDLLRFLGERGWRGAPRFLGHDDEGREMLGWVDGEVPWSADRCDAGMFSADALAAVAVMARELHDLTAGTPLAGIGEVVCHHDLSPKNTVYRRCDGEAGEAGEWRPVAFIDWDAAGPGRRIQDVAHVCWQWVLGDQPADVDAAARLVRVIADAYGLDAADRDDLIDTVLWWQDQCLRGIQGKIDAGRPSVARLEAIGAVDMVRADLDWTLAHRTELDRALRP